MILNFFTGVNKLSVLLVSFAAGCFLSPVVWAQDDCSVTLKKAQKTYDDGVIEDVETILAPCLKEGFNKQQKIQAYKLLVLVNLYNDNLPPADEAMLNLLHTEPEYEINPTVDPEEFIQLYNTYRTNPLFSVGLVGGGNFTFVKQITPIALNSTASNPNQYTPSLGYQVGLQAEMLLHKSGIVLGAGALFVNNRIRYTNTMFGFSELSYDETQNRLEVPLYLKCNIGKNKLRYFVYAGAAYQTLITATASVNRTILSSQQNEAVGPDESVEDQRAKTNYSILAGAGIKYKLGYGFIVFDVSYRSGLLNVASNDNRYGNNDLVFKYGHLDSDFYQNNLMVNVGYMKSFYHPRKMRNKKPPVE